jgi:hypothetical protein
VTVTAHAGHWLVQLLYAAPVLVLVIALLWGRVQDWRSRRRGEAE